MLRLTTHLPRARHMPPAGAVAARSLLPALLLALLAGGCAENRAPLAPAPEAPSPATGELAKVRTDTFTLQAYAIDSVHVAGSQNAGPRPTRPGS